MFMCREESSGRVASIDILRRMLCVLCVCLCAERVCVSVVVLHASHGCSARFWVSSRRTRRIGVVRFIYARVRPFPTPVACCPPRNHPARPPACPPPPPPPRSRRTAE